MQWSLTEHILDTESTAIVKGALVKIHPPRQLMRVMPKPQAGLWTLQIYIENSMLDIYPPLNLNI